jgi:pimeloyl-ACP methyl ester carboxylesterase
MMRRTFVSGMAVGLAAALGPVRALADAGGPGGRIATGTVTSADGTPIAYERIGAGLPLILVVGAFNDVTKGAPLAAALADRFTVLTYDRRGRGKSGNVLPYAVEREIEDLGALVELAGGKAAVLGYSSGAVLALRAAAAGVPITKLIMHDAPLVVDAMRPVPPASLVAELETAIEEGRRGDAVELFQLRMIGMPPAVVEQLRNAPFRPGLEAMAHTLPYELKIIGDGLAVPFDLLPKAKMPTLVVDGQTTPWMTRTAEVLAAQLPNGRHLSIAGLGHELTPELLAEPVAAFLAE